MAGVGRVHDLMPSLYFVLPNCRISLASCVSLAQPPAPHPYQGNHVESWYITRWFFYNTLPPISTCNLLNASEFEIKKLLLLDLIKVLRACEKYIY